MRTTVRLSEHLLAQVKAYALRHGQTLTGLIEEALRRLLTPNRRKGKPARLTLTTFKGKGLQPGADLDTMADLLDYMEREKH